MTRTRGDEDIEGGGGLRKILDTRKGVSEKKLGEAPKIFILQNQQEWGGGGLLKNWTVSRVGC